MEKNLKKIKNEFSAALKAITSSQELERLRTAYLGRKGIVTGILRQVADLAEQERPKIGKLANEIKGELEKLIISARHQLSQSGISEITAGLDATLPGINQPLGHLHPVTVVQQQLEEVFAGMGFMVLDGPEIESEYYNFTALNIPPDHPARDAHDTFWLKDGNLLRTHTSPVQVRALQKHGAPFRGIVPGKCFRYEATDASHETVFYQMEGLMVDKNISISNLIAMMQVALESIFLTKVDVRLRPGYFPFVEPGFELDIKCLICHGGGCPVCKRSGWVELMPCGLVHPEVLRASNVSPDEYSGFAFGLGLTRLVMMKYGIDDVRLLQSGDLRFLQQF